MIVDEIDIERLAITKAKDDAPIRPHRDGPKSFKRALERMKPQARAIHPLYRRCGIERGKDIPSALDHVRRQFAAIIILEEPLKSFVAEALDHANV